MVFSHDSPEATTRANDVTPVHSPQGELADQTCDEYNNSLIFGNDQKDDSARINVLEAVNEDSALFHDEETQADLTRLRLDVSPDESPFLNKVKDPFEDTLSVTNGSKNGEDMSRDLQSRELGRNELVFSENGDQRIVYAADDSLVIERDTQKGVNDTQLILNTTQGLDYTQILPKDTQVIPKDTQVIPKDTQVIPKDTQVIPKDTQVIPKETQILLKDTPMIPKDTQILPKDTRLSQSTQEKPTNRHTIDINYKETEAESKEYTDDSSLRSDKYGDTQVIPEAQKSAKGGSASEKSNKNQNGNSQTTIVSQERTRDDVVINETTAYTPGVLRTRTSFNVEEHTEIPEITKLPRDVFDPTRSLMQIPGTVERNNIKHFVSPKTQVMNTQEYLVEESMDVDAISKPVLSSSQNQVQDLDNSEESVNSDDERAYKQIQPLVDSVMKHKIEERERVDEDLHYREVLDDTSMDISPLKNKDKVVPPKMHQEKRRLSDSDSQLTPQELELGEDELKILLPKRRKTNVMESQSQVLSQSTPDILLEETATVIPKAAMNHRNGVWAEFKFKMYPGIVIEAGVVQAEILFEEGTFSIKSGDLFLLDIRIGDSVKIKGSNVAYIVVGLSSQPSSDGIKCIRGYNTVHLKKKVKTRSNKTQDITAQLSECYMELTDWYEHQQKFTVEIADDTEDTFTSIIQSNLKSPAKRQTQDVKQHSVNLVSDLTKGLFAGSIFCITGVDNIEKDELENVIRSNGGQLLDEGFMELFTYKRNRSGLHLQIGKVKLDKFKFVALISNGHSRSSKYLQAVSLGWPVLSTQFIHDCDAFHKTFENWPVYLLPAGQSLKINGVKSLNIHEFRQGFESGVNVGKQIHINGHLMNDFVILGLKNHINDKELSTCEFIFYCFGAGGFKLLDSTKQIVDSIKRSEYGTKKVLVYDNSGFFKKNYFGPKKARKANKVADKSVGLIDWEWVVQCCISSFIWECAYFVL